MSQRITARASSAICTVRCFVSIGLFTASRNLSDSLLLWYPQRLPAGMREELLPLLPTLFDDPLRASPCAVMDSTRFCPSYGIFFTYGVYGTRHFHTVSGASFDVWHIGLYIPLFASALWASWQEAPVLQKACGLSQSPCLSCPSNLMHAHISVLLGSLLSLFKSFRLCSLRGLSISLTST
jgi:hypothetical protein